VAFRDSDFLARFVSRRSVIKAGFVGLAASQISMLDSLMTPVVRPSLASTAVPSDVQFDIGAFVPAAQTFNDGAGNVVGGFSPVFNLFAPVKLTRNPTRDDKTVLSNALATIESNFAFSPSGAFVFVHYGLPYFNRLPSALTRDPRGKGIPRLITDHKRLALEESIVFPTDFTGGLGTQNPTIVKERFNVVVQIETNDMLFHMRSDSLPNLQNILNWLQGSNNLNGAFVQSPAFNGLMSFQTARVNFVQPGLPRKVADQQAFFNPAAFEFHTRINPDAPMVMGFMDQQADSSAPSGSVVAFTGSNHAVLTDAEPGEYFDNGCIAHFSHDIDDLFQFYLTPAQDPTGEGEPFSERVQYMFRSNQLGTTNGLAAQPTNTADEFSQGGGPAFVNNVFQGANAAERGARDNAGTFTANNATLDATFTGTPRIGHEAALQRSSRANDGTPLHQRNDGPGLDGLDVPQFQDFPGTANANTFPAGTSQFKLHFIVFVPTAEFFRQMRTNVAAQDLQADFNVDPGDNGLERFITATRRQNFLSPPRRNRAFPLVEFT
jgi:hypothetical protein